MESCGLYNELDHMKTTINITDSWRYESRWWISW